MQTLQQECSEIIRRTEEIMAKFLYCHPRKEVILDDLESRGMTIIGAYALWYQCLGRMLEGPISIEGFHKMMIHVAHQEGVHFR